MPDTRKSLGKLREEWSDCTKCQLGARRMSVDGGFVFGEGVANGVMFIGDDPGKEEEATGRPFSGSTGQILRRIIEKLNLTEYYLTTLVACRSCTPFTDAAGLPSMRKNWKTKQMEIAYRDDLPTSVQIDACAARVYEQIYLVDPVVIVALGPAAAKMLLQKPVNVMSPEIRGQPVHINIPGAGFSAVRTEKREAWVRSAGGKIELPIEQSQVRYLCIPTLHLSLVEKKLSDVNSDSPFRHVAADIQKAVQIYERYMLEVFGTLPSTRAQEPLEFTDLEIAGPDNE